MAEYALRKFLDGTVQVHPGFEAIFSGPKAERLPGSQVTFQGHNFGSTGSFFLQRVAIEEKIIMAATLFPELGPDLKTAEILSPPDLVIGDDRVH